MTSSSVVLDGNNLNLCELYAVSTENVPISLTTSREAYERVEQSRIFFHQSLKEGKKIYGVTTGFGGLGNILVPPEHAEELQNNIFWFWKSACGKRLPKKDVRAAMIVRANSLVRGYSGVRWELIERFSTLLNAGVTPHVFDLGSIGASGDLQPLAYIGGCVTGHAADYKVEYQGKDISAIEALKSLGLPPLRLQVKEGLALVNGSSVMTGIAANNIRMAQDILSLCLATQALVMQGIGVSNQSFAPFVHKQKPHPGQIWTANTMLELLDSSLLVHDELSGQGEYRGGLIQDRYSLRALPHYTAPIAEGIQMIARQITAEMNSSSDNPLVDVEHGAAYHCANFYGEHIAIGMDQLRSYMSLLIKHLDVQVALLATAEFNGGLAPSLIGNTNRKTNMGLVSLQVVANSIMPMISFLGNSFADRYATHAEQYNQNINSIGFASANFARQSLDLCHRYLSVILPFAIQGIDLRTYQNFGHYNSREVLSPAGLRLYDAFYQLVGRTPRGDRPYIWNDDEQVLEEHVKLLWQDLQGGTALFNTVKGIRKSLETEL